MASVQVIGLIVAIFNLLLQGIQTSAVIQKWHLRQAKITDRAIRLAQFLTAFVLALVMAGLLLSGKKQLDYLQREAMQHDRFFSIEEGKTFLILVKALRSKICAGGPDRAEALQMLKQYTPKRPPDQKTVADVLNCSSEIKLERVGPLAEEASEGELESRFLELVNRGRLYKSYGLDAAAAQAFYQAHTGLPELYKTEVNFAKLEKAVQAYQDRNYTEAADLYAEALEGVATSK